MNNKLIITADDFGVCPLIDEGVIAAIENEQITAVAVLPNGTDSDFFRVNELHILHGDRIDIGCHFNITNGPPLTDLPASFTRIKDGVRLFNYILGYDLKKLNLHALREELTAQVARFEHAGIPIKHFSDHFGILSMLEPAVCKVMLEVVRAYNERHGRIVPVRNPMLLSIQADRGSCLRNSKLKKLGRLANFIRRTVTDPDEENQLQLFKQHLSDMQGQYQERGIVSTDYFMDQYYGIRRQDLVKKLECLTIYNDILGKKAQYPSRLSSDVVFEMVVHIGRKSSRDEQGLFHYYRRYWKWSKKALNTQRPRELKYLKDFHAANALQETYETARFSDLNLSTGSSN